MNEVVSILIVGVGGQGTLLASKLLGRILLAEGYDVKVSELHGMSQRGGSVATYVKYGKKVYSPVIDDGEADFIVSFEMLEAARWAHCLKPGGLIITNTQQIDPMPVTTGAAEYPGGLAETLADSGIRINAFDALTPAVEAGSAKAVNILLMGRLARYLGIGREKWIEAIKLSVPPKFTEMNLKAFETGYGMN